MTHINQNDRPAMDSAIQQMADYVVNYQCNSSEALETARYCLFDALGCGLRALHDDECLKHLGPVVPGASMNQGVPIPGTTFELEPVQAAFNIGTQIRWLDYNDTWLAAEWGHPSDNLGAILACADYANRHLGQHYTMHDVLQAQIQAYEIQGIMALENSFNRLGIDHVILVRIASTAVAAKLLGANRNQIANAISNAWIDGGALRTYRHAPNTGWRKSWAAGDATSRAVRHALMAIKNEMGYPSALSAEKWGFYDVINGGGKFSISRPYDSYVMENILFKVAFPVEFHAQTAVECALLLHTKSKDRLDHIERIELQTQEAAMRIINKTGPLHNPADRDHSLQYAVAVALIHGKLESHHYNNDTAADPRIDQLRALMQVTENKQYSIDYLDADKRSIANAVKVIFKDGSHIKSEVRYPIGHRRRRDEAQALLREKLIHAIQAHLRDDVCLKLLTLLENGEQLEQMRACHFMDLWRST